MQHQNLSLGYKSALTSSGHVTYLTLREALERMIGLHLQLVILHCISSDDWHVAHVSQTAAHFFVESTICVIQNPGLPLAC